MRGDAPVNKIKLAVARALTAAADETRWRELALLVDDEGILDYPRLLRSLRWGDPDYPANVLAVVPRVLGEQPGNPRADGVNEPRLNNLPVVEEFLDLSVWLAQHEPALHRELYGREDNEVLPDLETHAELLDVDEARNQVRRLRRDLAEDLPAAVGHVKELVETVCKAILGLHGGARSTQLDLPVLVKKTLVRLQLHPSQVQSSDPGADDVRRVLQAVAQPLSATAPYRNIFGTGHGRSGGPRLDAAAGRFMVRSACDAVVFLLDVHQVWQEQLRGARVESLSAGEKVVHMTFGEGVVDSVTGTAELEQATINFAEGPRRLLLRYAPLARVT